MLKCFLGSLESRHKSSLGVSFNLCNLYNIDMSFVKFSLSILFLENSVDYNEVGEEPNIPFFLLRMNFINLIKWTCENE
ncbi:hypothetical protein Glove_53g99 [Diversispora epigaea]|uniref:Uncharacterized protein n=1 Tax=Diversispora epigaea TaxID=1348612 RepID=A0A397JD20_9GLOM|nr:hypothetical protein Glove_53g99 [Diversispora epigaea]